MKVSVVVMAASLMLGCGQDPRVPLDMARRDINDVQTYQLQADRLRPLQDDLKRVVLLDARVRSVSVGLFFSSSCERLHGSRLVVEYVVLLELRKDALPSTQPDELDKYVQDLVRDALASCGWEVEEANTYCYENKWRVLGKIRGAGKPPSAGAGLDLLPGRSSGPGK